MRNIRIFLFKKDFGHFFDIHNYIRGLKQYLFTKIWKKSFKSFPFFARLKHTAQCSVYIKKSTQEILNIDFFFICSVFLKAAIKANNSNVAYKYLGNHL